MIAHRGVAIEGMVDYVHFLSFFGDFVQFPGVRPFLVFYTIIHIYMKVSTS